MLKILAIETSSDALSVALLQGDELWSYHQIKAREHASLLLPTIESALKENELSLNQLSCIAVGRGPGSFVGVRIAISAAQGLALALNIPVAPISTLEALARKALRVTGAPSVVVAIDARMNEVYWAHYTWGNNGDLKVLSEEQLSAPSALNPIVEEGCIGFGTGWAAYESAMLQNPLLDPVVRIIQPDVYPDAKDVATLGVRALERGFCLRADQVLPQYLRDNVAYPMSK